jgi:hypothetical protein
MNPELLSERVIEKQGSFEKVVRYWKGWRPELENAVLLNGWQGRETRQEIFIVRARQTFKVNER